MAEVQEVESQAASGLEGSDAAARLCRQNRGHSVLVRMVRVHETRRLDETQSVAEIHRLVEVVRKAGVCESDHAVVEFAHQ